MYKEEDFDILVKSTLEPGTEDVPAGMWESVQKRIDAVSPVPVLRRRLWKRWTAGIAFACVAACCLLLLTPRKEENAAPVVASVPGVESVPDGEFVPSVAPVTVATASAIVTETPKTDMTASAEPTGTTEPAETAKPTEPAETAETPEPAGHVIETESGEPKTTTQTMPSGQFAMFEPERPAKRIRYALTGSAISGSHSGGRSSFADRMSTSQMDFGSEEKIYESAGTFYMIPISAGIGIRISFTKRWALGVGLNYTFLHRHFEGLYDYGGSENYYCDNISNNQHYIGIPVNAYYNITSGNRLKFYVYAGGTIEKCVSNSYSFNYYGYTKFLKQPVGGLQASINAGLGLQFCITDRFGIYLDPSFRYYFRNYLQPKSIRTAQPFQINAELGLRWDL